MESALHGVVEVHRLKADFHHINFNLGGMHHSMLADHAAQFRKLAAAHPEAARGLREVSVKPSSHFESIHGTDRVWAHADYATGTHIEMNQSLYGRPVHEVRAEIARNIASGWHPKGTEAHESVFTHEFGHVVDGHLKRSADKAGKEAAYLASTSRMLHGGRASTYAEKNLRESFAESFAQMHHAKPEHWTPATHGLKKLLDHAGKAAHDRERWSDLP